MPKIAPFQGRFLLQWRGYTVGRMSQSVEGKCGTGYPRESFIYQRPGAWCQGELIRETIIRLASIRGIPTGGTRMSRFANKQPTISPQAQWQGCHDRGHFAARWQISWLIASDRRVVVGLITLFGVIFRPSWLCRPVSSVMYWEANGQAAEYLVAVAGL